VKRSIGGAAEAAVDTLRLSTPYTLHPERSVTAVSWASNRLREFIYLRQLVLQQQRIAAAAITTTAATAWECYRLQSAPKKFPKTLAFSLYCGDEVSSNFLKILKRKGVSEDLKVATHGVYLF